MLDDAVARQDTVTQLIAAIRWVAREVPGAAELVAAHCTGHDYTSAGKPQIAWDDPVARDELVSALVTDALALLAALDLQGIQDAGGAPAQDGCPHIDDPAICARTILVDTFGISAVAFDLSRADQERLYQSGRDAATTFLDAWDFATYSTNYPASTPGLHSPGSA